MKNEGEQPAAPTVRVMPVAEGDVERVAQLAAEVWWHHYPSIISPAQIEYMLRQRYDPALMCAELQRDDVWWDKLVAGDRIVAFASCCLVDNREMKLDKLYVHPAHQRRGYGGMLIDHVRTRAREQGCSQVVLAVNKRNGSAVAAYAKYGFLVRASVITDIGGGFVMDDYVMARRP